MGSGIEEGIPQWAILAAMRVQIVTNPNAGRGRGAQQVSAVVESLTSRGHIAIDQPITRLMDRSTGEPDPDGFDVLVIAGGDGTIRAMLRRALARAIPIYHLPTGTENLFAREFGMSADPGDVVEAIEAGVIRAVDVGVCDSSPFALMCSIGPDAGVIHRLVRTWTGPISHRSYVRPILAEIARPHLPRVSVCADGQRVVEEQRGLLVVANCRQYGFRLDPARRASMSDGLLDLVFMPCRSSTGALRWAARARLGTHERDHRIVHLTATRFELSWDDPRGLYQVDGEAAAATIVDGRASMVVGIRPGVLRVLMPANHTPA